MKITYKKLIFQFLIYFIIITLITRGINDNTWLEALSTGMLNAVFFSIFFYISSDFNTPIYLKLHHQDKILAELDHLGAKKIKEKGEFTTYALKNKRWPFNRIKMKKTPFYIYIQATPEVNKHFLAYMN